MAIDRVAGAPDFTFNTGTSAYIPIVFSAKTLKRFYETTLLNEITNTDYLGEIKNQGDTVIIRTEPDVTIRDYKKGMDLQLENPESPAIELQIDKAKYFNFALDDVDKQQMDINLMDKWAANAATRMKIVVEREFFIDLSTALGSAALMGQAISPSNYGATAGAISANVNLGTTGANLSITRANILDTIVYTNQVLDEQNAPQGNRWIVLPAWATSLIKLSDLKDASFSGQSQSLLLSNGRVGKIDGVTIYSSNLLYTTGGYTYIPFGCQEALAFAMTLTKTEMYRPERTFSNAMKGLQVYAHKIIQPKLTGMIVGVKG